METHKVDKKIKFDKKEDYVSVVHDHGIDTVSNQLYLFGVDSYSQIDGEFEEPGVEYRMANTFIKNINMLMRVSEDPILIHMKTCGGDWHEGMAIYNYIRACPNPVTILSSTHARSMSSIILQAANKRVMMPDSYFMFHEGEEAYMGTTKQVRSNVEFFKDLNTRMVQIYTTAILNSSGSLSKYSSKKISAWIWDRMKTKEDCFLTDKEAVKYGFADCIFGEDGTYDWGKLLDYTDKELER